MKRNKTITEKDIYHFYPYKKNPPYNGKTVPQPYVRKEDVSDNVFTLTYDMWLSIVKDYILELRDYILKGKVFKIPKQLGTWQLKKYNVNNVIDWAETRAQGKRVYMKNPEVNLVVKWYRTPKNSQFQFKNHWKLRIVKGFRIALNKIINKDPNYIYNLIDT